MTRLVFAAVLLLAGAARATPSATFWTYNTTYVQPFGVPHLTYDAYFDSKQAHMMATGVEIGVLPFNRLQGEVGFDLFLPANDLRSSLALNGKIGMPQHGYWPGVTAGIYNVGLTDVSNFNIVHLEVGRTTRIGTFTAGGYYGLNEKLFPGVTRGGFMGSYLTPDVNVNAPGLERVAFFADLQTGSNPFSAVGFGTNLAFNSSIALMAGPVFFLNPEVAPADVVWSFQMDIDVDVTP